MKTIRYFLLAAFSAFLFSACGPGGPQGAESGKEEAPIVDADGTLLIKLNADDHMRYDKLVLRAKAGQKVRLTLAHVGKGSVSAMGHDFVLLKEGVDAAKFAQKAALAAATGFVPESEKENVIAHTRMLGGGESDTIEFTVEKAGKYTYLCSFPGHFTTMRGELIVE
ncbi:MAG TPA: plastocyanin/azurin family copper-binding protein [Chthoniobacteraceae bacterium]|nr:plastocyanin/azurin family copper-binding protein [Chthoniobacteraceae bacterium]